MAASGSYDYTVTAEDIITAAMQDIGAVDPGESITTEERASCLRTLNFLVKQWQGQSDFAPGLKTWTRKRAYVFLQKGQSAYNLGPSGDHAALSYVTTTLTANAAQGASTITVAAITGMATTYAIGVQLNSGALQWTTINGAPSGSTVTLTATLTGAANSGNRVFVYQTKLQQRPLDVLTAVLRDSASQDTALDMMTFDEYEALGDKTADGDPSAVLYEAQLTNGALTLDQEPDDVTKVVRLVFLSPVDDLDSSTNDLVYPQVWFAALEWGLAKRIAPSFQKPWGQDKQDIYQEALAIARNADPETSNLCFEPGLDN